MRHSKASAGILASSLFIVLLLFSTARADWRSERPVTMGVTHTFIRREKGPWEINVIQANLKDNSLSLAAVLSDGMVRGNSTLSKMADSISIKSDQVVAGINGDFFRREPDAYAGDPFGLQISRGELISFPYRGRANFLITADRQVHISSMNITTWAISSKGLRHTIHGLNEPRENQKLIIYTPRFGASTGTDDNGVELIINIGNSRITPNCELKARVMEIRNSGDTQIPPGELVLSGSGVSAWFLKNLELGEELTLSFSMTPQLGEIIEAIGGGPRIVREGKVSVEWQDGAFAPSFANSRHPRSAVGFSDKSLFLVTVDGRQPGRSEGMTLDELAWLMLDLGCKEALNLDGGGSTEMLIKGRVANSPSDGRERLLANALLLLSSAPAGIPTTLNLEAANSVMLAGGQTQLALHALDQYYKSCEVKPQEAQWNISPPIGRIDSEGVFSMVEKPDITTKVVITAKIGNSEASTEINVYPLPTALEVMPQVIHLQAGQVQQFIAEGKASDGSSIPSPLFQPVWSCSPEIGAIDYRGYFRASQIPGEGAITAKLRNATGQARVIIGKAQSIAQQHP